MKIKLRITIILISALCIFNGLLTPGAYAAAANGYVANKENLRSFFETVSSYAGKPTIVSKLAMKKQISGNFDLTEPYALIERLSAQMGLIWYDDGKAIYIYDSSEMRNALINLRKVSTNEFNNFLKKSGLYNSRYEIKGGGNGTFYVSGSPVYVDLVVNAAKLMEQNSDGIEIGRNKVGIIHLVNTFVNDRTYELRGEKIVIPGMAKVLNGQMKSIDNKSSLQVDRNSSFSLQTNGIEQLSTKKVLNMTSRDQGLNSELSDKTIQFKGGIHNGIHTEKITVQNHSNNKEREKKYRDGDKKNGEQAHLLDITNERRFADNKTMFTQHIEKQRNVHTLNQNDINNSVNSANVPENELTYQFQRWGQNHTVRILESSEGIRLKPSDTIVSDRLHEAQHNDVTAQRWVLTEQDERQGQRHQPHDEQENEGKFENDQKDES